MWDAVIPLNQLTKGTILTLKPLNIDNKLQKFFYTNEKNLMMTDANVY